MSISDLTRLSSTTRGSLLRRVVLRVRTVIGLVALAISLIGVYAIFVLGLWWEGISLVAFGAFSASCIARDVVLDLRETAS